MKPGRRLIPAAVAALASAAILAVPSAAAPNVATTTSPQVALDWNLNAVNIVRGATVPLPKFQIEGLIHMSYVQAAVYDATTKIEGRYAPYHDFAVDPSIVANASPEAAIIAAAYTTLAYYFSDQPATLLDPLKAQYDAALAALPDQGEAEGVAVGQAAANDIIALRANDGRNAPITFTPGPPGPGVWQFAPPPSLQFAQTPWVAFLKPFMLQAASQFCSDPPPALSSTQWAEGFNEVKAYGAANSTVRTPAQTAVGLFWNAHVINQYNQAFRELAVQHGFDLVDTVRLLAMGNLVGAAADHAQPPGVPGRPRLYHGGGGRGLRRRAGHQPNRGRHPRLRQRRRWQLRRRAPLRQGQRPHPRDHRRPDLGRAPLPLVQRSGCHSGPQDGPLGAATLLPAGAVEHSYSRGFGRQLDRLSCLDSMATG